MSERLRRIGFDGLIAGLIGYVAIAAFFMVVNGLQGRSPFYTAALLGAALFSGLRDAASLSVEPGSVIAYNGLHIVVFVTIGLISARLALAVEENPRAFYPTFFLGLFGFIFLTGMIFAFALYLGSPLSFWSIGGAMLLSVTGMLTYLLGVNPLLRAEIMHLDKLDEADAG
jgi:hypothetical protein